MINGIWCSPGGKPIYCRWDPASGALFVEAECDNSSEALAREGLLMKTYTGYRQPDAGELGIPAVEVHEAGRTWHLHTRLDLKYNAGGFDWGPHADDFARLNLALALIADVTGDDELARSTCQRLKLRVIRKLAVDGWAMTEETLAAALAEIVAEDVDEWRVATEQ